jgi:non-ribosomal peptide synthetase component F
LFLNLIVVRSRVAGDRGFTALLEQVRKLSLEAYSHRDLPF